MRNCQNCSKKNVWRKTSDTQLVNGQRVRIWQCRCGHLQAEEPAQAPKVKPKVLYFDIETALMTVSLFSLFVKSKYIPASAIIENSFVICWSACWINTETDWQYIYSSCVRQKEALEYDDRRILKELWNMLDAADYVVGHNSDKFDVKKVNYRFLLHGYGAPYMSKQHDTLKMARKWFGAESNALDDWAERLGYAGKHEMEREDWDRIRATGDPDSLLKMEMYNRQDVRAGMAVYVDFVRWIESSGRVVFK